MLFRQLKEIPSRPGEIPAQTSGHPARHKEVPSQPGSLPAQLTVVLTQNNAGLRRGKVVATKQRDSMPAQSHYQTTQRGSDTSRRDFQTNHCWFLTEQSCSAPKTGQNGRACPKTGKNRNSVLHFWTKNGQRSGQCGVPGAGCGMRRTTKDTKQRTLFLVSGSSVSAFCFVVLAFHL